MSLIDFGIDKMENGIKVRLFSSGLTDTVILKEWIVTDTNDACDRLQAIIDQIRQMEKTGAFFEERLIKANV